MQTQVAKKIIEICSALNKHSVKYLIVGGTAVAFHGYFRWSVDSKGLASEKFDLDFWYNPTYSNYFNLLNALADLGQDVDLFKKEKTPKPKSSFFKFEFDAFIIDFLPELKGLKKFMNSYDKREIVELEGVQLFFISFDDLITDKSTSSRPKDIEDIKHLKSKDSN